MSLSLQSGVVSVASIFLYFGLAAWGVMRKRFSLAGLAMCLAAMIPPVWQAVATDSEAKGEGLLATLLLVPAIIFVGIGIAKGLIGWLRRFTPTAT